MTQEEFDVLSVFNTLTEDEKYIVASLIKALLELRTKELEK